MKIGIVLGMGGASSPYNQMAQLGLKMAQDRYGVAYEERAPKNELDVGTQLEELVKSDQFELVIGFGYASGQHIRRLSAQSKDRHFAVVDAHVEAQNVASYIARQVDIGFLAGYAAGALTETQRVGSIFGVDDENMRRWVIGYSAGAVYHSSNTQVFYSFVGSWDNPPKAYELAIRQFQGGADIIMAHANAGDPGILRAAQERQRHVIGWSGERKQYPGQVLFDVERHAEVCVLDAVRMTVEGKFTGGVYVFGLAEGNWDLTLADAHQKVNADLRREIADTKDKIVSGELKMPEASDLSLVTAKCIE